MRDRSITMPRCGTWRRLANSTWSRRTIGAVVGLCWETATAVLGRWRVSRADRHRFRRGSLRGRGCSSRTGSQLARCTPTGRRGSWPAGWRARTPTRRHPFCSSLPYADGLGLSPALGPALDRGARPRSTRLAAPAAQDSGGRGGLVVGRQHDDRPRWQALGRGIRRCVDRGG